MDNVRQGGFKPPDRPPFGQAERTPVDKVRMNPAVTELKKGRGQADITPVRSSAQLFLIL